MQISWDEIPGEAAAANSAPELCFADGNTADADFTLGVVVGDGECVDAESVTKLNDW